MPPLLTVNDQKVQFSPSNIRQKLLNQAILPWAPPDDRVVLLVQKEPDRHHGDVLVRGDGVPPLVTLVHFLALWDLRGDFNGEFEGLRGKLRIFMGFL